MKICFVLFFLFLPPPPKIPLCSKCDDPDRMHYHKYKVRSPHQDSKSCSHCKCESLDQNEKGYYFCHGCEECLCTCCYNQVKKIFTFCIFFFVFLSVVFVLMGKRKGKGPIPVGGREKISVEVTF